MNHLTSIISKLVLVALVLYFVLGMGYGIDMSSILLLSALVTGLAYLVGDLLILPAATKATHEMTGNLIAAAADFGLVFLTLWLAGRYFIGDNIDWVTASLISAAIIGVCEIIFHRLIRGLTIKQVQT